MESLRAYALGLFLFYCKGTEQTGHLDYQSLDRFG